MSKTRSLRNWLSLAAFVVIVATMDYMLIDYLVSHGLEPKAQPLQIGGFQFSIPLVGLTFAGVLIVAIAAWSNISSTMPITALREMSQLETPRILRAAGIALFFFSTVLFGPYMIGASAFWRQMASLSRTVPQLAGPLRGLFSVIQSAIDLDILGKLAISQNAAAAALVVVSGLIGHYQRRVRRTK